MSSGLDFLANAGQHGAGEHVNDACTANNRLHEYYRRITFYACYCTYLAPILSERVVTQRRQDSFIIRCFRNDQHLAQFLSIFTSS